MRSIRYLVALSLLIAAPRAAFAADPKGDWLGTVEYNASTRLRVAVHIEAGENGRLKGSLESLDQGSFMVVLTNIASTGDNLSFAAPVVGGRYEGKWDEGQKAWIGRWSQGGSSPPLVLKAGTAPPPPPPPSRPPPSPPVPGARDINVTNDVRYRWGELGIAVNPRNPNNIVIATQGLGLTQACLATSPDCRMVPAELTPGILFREPSGRFSRPDFDIITAFTSFDRGRTWKRVNVPTTPRGFPTIRSAGDPHITAGMDGTFYFSFDAMNWGTAERPLPNAGVAVSKSIDGGRTWSIPVLTGTSMDGPKITADLITGTIYEASSGPIGPKATGDPNTPEGKVVDRWLVSSTEGVSWTRPQPMGGTGFSMSAAHGILATAFKTSATSSIVSAANDALCGSAPKPCTIFQTTTDAGASWSRHVIPVPADFVADPTVPMVAADPSRKGHFALAVPMKARGGYLVYRTNDAGATWSGPASVTEDAGKAHFLPWMAYSRQGVLAIMWRTRQTAAGSPASAPSPYNVWAAISRDGGTTFSVPLKVSSADSPPSETSGGGDDYSALSVEGNHVYVGWADWRSKERDNYFRAIHLDEFTPARK